VDGSTRSRSGVVIGMIVIASGLAAVVGCASDAGPAVVNNGLGALKPDAIDPESGSIETGLEPGASQDEIARRLEESMRLYDELFDESDDSLAKQADASDTEDALVAESGEDQLSAEADHVENPEIGIADAVPTPEERARKLSQELEAVLRESADDPYALAIRLAGLLAGEENASDRLAALIDRLPVEQRAVARAVADIVSRAGSDPVALTDALVAQADALDEARPVRIRTLALCSRVEGFGRYTELGSTTFVAGTRMRMVIYTEVDHFDRTEIGRSSGGSLSEPDREPGFEIRLSQELQLYHEADGLLAWRRPEEVTAYRTRSRPRDFFVVNQIELPRSLTVGAYRLKVVMRDLGDLSVDERIIPIRVVADPALAAGNHNHQNGG